MKGGLVIELATGYGAAALAAKLLADLGCRVAKIEAPEGDTLRRPAGGLWDLVSGSKDSVCLDLGRSGVEAPLDRLLAAADILVADREGYRRLAGLFDLRARFPGLTVCVCSAYGLEGPMADWKGTEETVQAMSGIMSTTGHAGGRPRRIAAGLLTHATAILAVTSCLADLEGKRRHGAAGGLLDVSLFDTALSFLTAAIPAFFLEGTSPVGIGNRHAMAAPWNSFTCRDGWVIICAGNNPTWLRLCEAIGRPDLPRDPGYASQADRVRHVDRLEAEIAAWTAERTVAEVERLLDAKGIPCGSILSLDQVLAHPQFDARALIRRFGDRAIAGGVFFLDGAPLPVVPGRARLGEGTVDVLADACGATAEELRSWNDRRLIRDGEVTHAATV